MKVRKNSIFSILLFFLFLAVALTACGGGVGDGGYGGGNGNKPKPPAVDVPSDPDSPVDNPAPIVSGDEEWGYSFVSNDPGGADGVDVEFVGDFAEGADGTYYVASGFEQGNTVRVCVNEPGEIIEDLWRCVVAGKNAGAEFAKLVDFGDGIFNVISAGDGGIMLHIAPADPFQYFNKDFWKTFLIPNSVANSIKQQWNNVELLYMDGEEMPLVLAGGHSGGPFGFFELPADPYDVDNWRFHSLSSQLKWVMGIHFTDMDGDGDFDVVVPDRGDHPTAGIWLFMNPGTMNGSWNAELLLPQQELRMMDVADVDLNGIPDLVTAVRDPKAIFVLLRFDYGVEDWELLVIPTDQYEGFPKGVAVGDIDNDGLMDIAVTTRNGSVYYLTQHSGIVKGAWDFHLINKLGDKDDNIALLDFDGDGCLDVMTTIEIPDLGIVIFWNPMCR